MNLSFLRHLQTIHLMTSARYTICTIYDTRAYYVRVLCVVCTHAFGTIDTLTRTVEKERDVLCTNKQIKRQKGGQADNIIKRIAC